jgi:hypothetical protein
LMYKNEIPAEYLARQARRKAPSNGWSHRESHDHHQSSLWKGLDQPRENPSLKKHRLNLQGNINGSPEDRGNRLSIRQMRFAGRSSPYRQSNHCRARCAQSATQSQIKE